MESLIKIFKKFRGVDTIIELWSDGAHEFVALGEQIGIHHPKAVPYRLQGNDIENDVALISDGVKTALLALGLLPSTILWLGAAGFSW